MNGPEFFPYGCRDWEAKVLTRIHGEGLHRDQGFLPGNEPAGIEVGHGQFDVPPFFVGDGPFREIPLGIQHMRQPRPPEEMTPYPTVLGGQGEIFADALRLDVVAQGLGSEQQAPRNAEALQG